MTNTTTTTANAYATFALDTEAWFAAYDEADRKGKAGMRTELDAMVNASVMGADIDNAQRLMGVKAEIGNRAKASTTTVDHVANVAALVATLRDLADEIMADPSVVLPDGITVSHDDVATRLFDPEFNDRNESVRKSVLARKVGRSAKRNDVPSMIEAALPTDGSFASVGDIRRAMIKNGADPKLAPTGGAIKAAIDRADKSDYPFTATVVNGRHGATLNK